MWMLICQMPDGSDCRMLFGDLAKLGEYVKDKEIKLFTAQWYQYA